MVEGGEAEVALVALALGAMVPRAVTAVAATAGLRGSAAGGSLAVAHHKSQLPHRLAARVAAPRTGRTTPLHIYRCGTPAIALVATLRPRDFRPAGIDEAESAHRTATCGTES